MPVTLKNADLSLPFVYDRKWGLFYVPMGYHQSVMATLLAFHSDCLNYQELSEKMQQKLSQSECADTWLETIPGAAFKSSVGKTIQIGRFNNLSVLERRVFAGATEVF